MDYKRFGSKIIARFDKGEEILESLTSLCEKEDIKLASLSAIGAISKATIGCFNVIEKKYYSKEYSGIFEIISLNGNISTMNGETYLHIHCSFADEEYQLSGGHLNAAVVSATCEMVIDLADGEIDREFSDEIGLNLCKFQQN